MRVNMIPILLLLEEVMLTFKFIEHAYARSHLVVLRR